MKQVKKDLKVLAKDLRKLTQKTEKIAKNLAKLERTQAPKKSRPRAKAARKTTRVSASNVVLALIKRSKKGIDTAILRKKTGFDYNKMRGIVYRLKEQGKIKSGGRGIYVKA